MKVCKESIILLNTHTKKTLTILFSLIIINYTFYSYLVQGLKLYEDVVDTTGIGFKLSVGEVVLSNFEETAKKICIYSHSRFPF